MCSYQFSYSVQHSVVGQLMRCYRIFRDTCIALLKSLPTNENQLFKSCARYQGTVTEVNELHEKVTVTPKMINDLLFFCCFKRTFLSFFVIRQDCQAWRNVCRKHSSFVKRANSWMP